MGSDELFVPHMPQLYHAAVQILRHPQDSEDALQEGLMAAFRKRDQFQGRAKFSTWLHSIVVNAALMKLRHRKRELTMTSMDGEFEDGDLHFERLIPDQRQNPEEEYSDLERFRMLADMVCELPERYRTVLQMCDLDGLMEKEVAERLGTVVGVIKSRRHRGRKMLMRRFKYRSCRGAAPAKRGYRDARRGTQRHRIRTGDGLCTPVG